MKLLILFAVLLPIYPQKCSNVRDPDVQPIFMALAQFSMKCLSVSPHFSMKILKECMRQLKKGNYNFQNLSTQMRGH